MKASLQRSESFKTSVSAPVDYELSPSDAIFGLQLWFSTMLFFRHQLDWNRLQEALVEIERAYPPLCGRYIEEAGSRRSIKVKPESDNCFHLVEIEVNATLVHLRASKKMASCCRESDYVNVNWPYFLDQDCEGPPVTTSENLFGVHLTRATDGCILSFSQYHMLCDGGSTIQLGANIGRAYRGLKIETPHLDRSLMWPDQYLSHFSVPGHSPDMYPRRFVPRQRELGEEASHVAEIHLQQEVVNRMKQATKHLLHGVDFVSTSDLLVALCWLLRIESIARKQSDPQLSLPIEGTSIQFPVDTRSTCVPVVPRNHFGNTLGRGIVTYTPEGGAVTHIEKLAHAASLIRRAVHDIQTEPQSALEALLVHYRVGCTDDPTVFDNCVGVVAPNTSLTLDGLSFGQPYYPHASLCFPCTTTQSSASLSPDGDGAICRFVVPARDTDMLETSTVLAECASGAVVLADIMNEQQALTLAVPHSRM